MTSSFFLHDGLLFVIPPDARCAPYFLRLEDGAVGHEEDSGVVVWSLRTVGGTWTRTEVTAGDARLEALHEAMRYAPGRPPEFAEMPAALPTSLMRLDDDTVKHVPSAELLVQAQPK